MVKEDTTYDSETNHVSEVVEYLALEVAEQAGDEPLKAEVLFRRAMFLNAQKDDIGARQAIDEALGCARRPDVFQLTVHDRPARSVIVGKREPEES